MLRALGLRSSLPSLTSDESTDRIVSQALKLEKALKAMDYVLDDRPTEAFELLKDHEEVAISELAYGVCEFLDATLGFEDQTMRHASEILSKAETKAWREKGISEKNKISASSVYPPGTEYAVAYAEANLLNALLMLMSENFVEAARALLKLRRAYHTLDTLSKSMERMNNGEVTTVAEAMKNLGLGSVSTPSLLSTDSLNSITHFADVPVPFKEQQLKDKEVISKLERIYRMRKARIGGSHIGNPPVSEVVRTHLGLSDDPDTTDGASDTVQYGNPEVSSVDEYIHSGVNLCFGILQVVLSLLPPGLGRVLSIVGFKGSREAGLRMVWKAAQERNIHGGIGLLALLVFYDGPFQFTDVDFDVPSISEMKNIGGQGSDRMDMSPPAITVEEEDYEDCMDLEDDRTFDEEDDNAYEDCDDNADSDLTSDEESFVSAEIALQTTKSSYKYLAQEKMDLERKATRGDGDPTILHPGSKLVKTLLHARALFPNSNLWLLQESRMLAGRGRLDEAVTLMDSAKPSQMKQVDALMFFDRCMLLVFLHRFERAGREFIALIKVNSYSHALYTYFAGACYLEAYRMCETGLFVKGNSSDSVDPYKKEEYKKLAEKYLLEAPKLIGKKKFLARIPPFEMFINRKYKEILQVKRETGLSLVECVGTSLIHEIAYFWNGYNRMPEECLRLSMKLLGYSASKTVDPELDLVNPETERPYTMITESREQSMIRHTLQALCLRRLGQVKKGMTVLDEGVLRYLTESGRVNPRNKMFKLTENPWLYPTALYEKALFCWKLKGVDGLQESMQWLKKSQIYGGDDYELSTRISLKTKAAIDRLEDLDFA
ncbi:DEKNAAC104459 [Brettanomyces naardenensis]|uniref:DEKNAAC104459 n=1 Tax=Brettanomyces naardenensis TaxID=13370 RepID=A0A448YR30_BRENA|nr:DEKNAAC104459 [Brettanomyces naardenensis]